MEMELPHELPQGTYQLVISDAQRYLQDEQQSRPFRFTAEKVEDVFAVLRDVASIRENALYLRLVRQSDGVAIGRTAMPQLPSSMRQVILGAGRSSTTAFVSSSVKIVPTESVMSGSAEFTIAVDANAKVSVGGPRPFHPDVPRRRRLRRGRGRDSQEGGAAGLAGAERSLRSAPVRGGSQTTVSSNFWILMFKRLALLIPLLASQRAGRQHQLLGANAGSRLQRRDARQCGRHEPRGFEAVAGRQDVARRGPADQLRVRDGRGAGWDDLRRHRAARGAPGDQGREGVNRAEAGRGQEHFLRLCGAGRVVC